MSLHILLLIMRCEFRFGNLQEENQCKFKPNDPNAIESVNISPELRSLAQPMLHEHFLVASCVEVQVKLHPSARTRGLRHTRETYLLAEVGVVQLKFLNSRQFPASKKDGAWFLYYPDDLRVAGASHKYGWECSTGRAPRRHTIHTPPSCAYPCM